MTAQRPHLFGTDGIRGTFGEPPLDERTVRRLARALARHLGPDFHVVLGGDTRFSTPELGRWLASELLAYRGRITWLGVIPTPAIAERTRALGASCGVVVSASHNPFPDNGIKLISSDGFKWTPERELELEALLQELSEIPPADDGPLEVDQQAVDAYRAYLLSTLGSNALHGLKVALDTGNGAASGLAASVFEELGATVCSAHHAPDGRNINTECGSTYPGEIARLTQESGSTVGFSFDGDADRVIFAGEDGTIYDGDAILYLWAGALDRTGRLDGRRIVATSMSNLGLEVALERLGIGLVRCDVGDREVVLTLEREGLVLGGEQSGHIVNRHLGTTGDGLLTALHLAHLMATEGRTPAELLTDFQRFPQLLRGVKVRHKPPLGDVPGLAPLVASVIQRLGKSGRLVLRYSGTEPLARIMLEGPDLTTIEGLSDELEEVLVRELAP